MNAIIICFVVGVLLLALEVFIPGGILGILGAVVLLVGCIATFRVYGEVAGVTALMAGLLLGGAVLYLEFVVLPKSALGRAIAVHKPSEVIARTDMSGLVGKTGYAETVLAPTGYVLIDGARHEALSQDGMIAKGASVYIVGVDAFRLLVNSTNKNT